MKENFCLENAFSAGAYVDSPTVNEWRKLVTRAAVEQVEYEAWIWRKHDVGLFWYNIRVWQTDRKTDGHLYYSNTSACIVCLVAILLRKNYYILLTEFTSVLMAEYWLPSVHQVHHDVVSCWNRALCGHLMVEALTPVFEQTETHSIIRKCQKFWQNIK